MGFASRSVSFMRYRVKGEVEGSFWDSTHEGVQKGTFREIDTPGDVIGMGWTSIDDFTDTSFQGSPYLRGNYIGLALRIDTVRVPPKVLEVRLKVETRKLLQETGRQRLSSGQRRELKERLIASMRSQVFPSIQVLDLVWDVGKALVYFGSHSLRARERVEDHFKKSFGLALIPVIPYLRAEELLGTTAEQDSLGKLKPCSMVP